MGGSRKKHKTKVVDPLPPPKTPKKCHRIQEIPESERSVSPPPGYSNQSCFSCYFVFFIFTFLVGLMVGINVFQCHPHHDGCSKAEQVVARHCAMKLERTRHMVETTIPDFSMTPIGRDIAEKCMDMEDCLSAVRCSDLRFPHRLPERCKIFKFFHIDFAACRDKIIETDNLPTCVKKFMVAGPVPCDVLKEHLECYKESIGKICDNESSVFHYFLKTHIEDYGDMIGCELNKTE
ncbi:hypothetical protein CRE_21207 [Caenorhabditis remanei]|uniref:Uncharacterized protein n=2 Tax=Caenorhabditis remanei TaxID=31234 RepID=E3MEV2_CAERE|nr:hypothetical protein CRE_21207 [Caenorhabditis remanei]